MDICQKTKGEQKYKVTKEEILLDLKLLTDGIFDGDISEEDGALVIKLFGVQRFCLILQEF